MAKVGAQRAAELTGRSKSTIQRAMKSGKISFEIDANDRRVIDVSELERAFGLLPQDSDNKSQQAVEAEIEKATQMLEIERLKMRIRMLEDQLDMAKEQASDLKEQRDQWQKQAQQTLITSQYSQKQAEELKEEIKQREQRARVRRQQMEDRVRTVKKVKNDNTSPADTLQKGGSAINGLWQKIRGAQESKPVANAAAEAAPVKEQAAG